ncbi:biotin--[acetyl-CoA-carboxylase] ligase [Echinicola sp. CAU 1574]|uniref:Biotin--[acetyl-CoA-carboxylase] ligase n=1 Tax=Echinicola arenosa TaxID=2774144 RepID=A0ABR9AFM2_9BACT|nr:biotin--[acetyl-CoA-carboxylase] ligase [Echinicola arenosa]MBD8487508.1 biotin--[acetyl-CoA-carboxylase] ligase [Echinicola arenosa]
MHKILANTVFLGKDIVYMTECHSTNDIAAEKLRNGSAKEGSIIITDKQTNGRGQRGNKWYSEPEKNLTFSLVLTPNFLKAMEQFELNKVVSLAVRDALSVYTEGVCVKWPNDIVHQSRGKIGGILIENTISKEKLESSIIGIGLNINQTEFPFPGPVSMANLAGGVLNKCQVLESILIHLEKRYLQLKKKNFAAIHMDYWQHLYQKEQWCHYEDIAGEFSGRIRAVNQQGMLEIEKTDESINLYAHKEVRFL